METICYSSVKNDVSSKNTCGICKYIYNDFVGHGEYQTIKNKSINLTKTIIL